MLKYRTQYAASALLGLCFMALAALAPEGVAFDIDWYTVDTGGGTAIGGTFQVDGTTGQADTQLATGGDYAVQGGFWSAFPIPCPGDVDSSGTVDINDLLDLLAAWGACPASPSSCPEDVDDNSLVDIQDLLGLLAGWGGCP